uniref:RRM domain-containing protein n=1 Tax=Oryza barthii TaxID=65489 RepID=A0A0D3H972_9ORYZ
MPELRWSCCLCAQAFHLIDMVLQPQQAGPMMPLLAQPPLAMALLYSSFNIWTTLVSFAMWKVYNLLCFVDFATPSEARAALETLQGQRGIALRSYVNLRFSVLYVNAKEMARAGLTHKQEPEEGGQLIGAIRRRERERHALGDDVGSGSGAEKSWAWGQGGGSCVRRQRRPSSAVAGVA